MVTEPIEPASDADKTGDQRTLGRADSGEAKPLSAEGTRGLIDRLDRFLEEQAEDHRHAMEEVVQWLWRSGNLETEIHHAVESVGSLFNKWTFEILFLLRMRGKMRFNQIKEDLTAVGQPNLGKKVADVTGLSSRTLSTRLKDLESKGLVEREVFAEVPLRVEYSLTPKGMRFGDLMMPVVAHMRIAELRSQDR